VDEVAGQLKKLAITGSSRKDRMFLGVDVGRLGFINRNNLRHMCVNHQLPSDDNIVDAVRTFICSSNIIVMETVEYFDILQTSGMQKLYSNSTL